MKKRLREYSIFNILNTNYRTMKKHKRFQLAGFINPIHSNSCPVVVYFVNHQNELIAVYPTGAEYQIIGTLDECKKLENFTPASEFSHLKIFYEKGVIGYVDVFGKNHLTKKESLRSLLERDIPRIENEDHRSMLIEMLEKLG